jgi:hypothetical protein
MAQFGSGLLGGAEGARGLGVIEAEGQPHALVEIRLGLGIGGGDRYVQRAEVLVQRRHAGAGGFAQLLPGHERLGLRLGQHQLGEQHRTAALRRRAGRAAGEQRIEAGGGGPVRQRGCIGGQRGQAGNGGHGHDSFLSHNYPFRWQVGSVNAKFSSG